MSRNLAERLAAVAPSATLAMAARAARLRAEGHRIFPFSVGEPDFDTPSHIRAAVKTALDAGAATHYTPVSGMPELKSAICAATERDRGYRPALNEIVVSCGAKHVLFNLALALFEIGDEVIIPSPYWVSYPEQVRIVGAEPVIVPTTEEQGFRLQPEALAAALTPKTKAVVLCTPSNPTGSAYAAEHLLPLLEILRKHDCWIIVDEIYGGLVYDGFEHVSLRALAPDLTPRLIVVDGVSKTYAMTGWRIGYAAGPTSIIKAMAKVQGQSTSNPTHLAQIATLAALTGPQDCIETMRVAFDERRRVLLERGADDARTEDEGR